MITLRFAVGERKICSTIKMSQNIMNMIEGLVHVFLHHAQLREPKPHFQKLSRNTSYFPKCGR